MKTGDEALQTNTPQLPVSLGSVAPDFALPQHQSDPVPLSYYRGQPVILAFQTSGWDPARAEQFAQYNKILARVPGLHAELISISRDGNCRLAVEDEDIQFPLLTDMEPDGAVAQLYGVQGRSALFLIDEAGIVRWHHVAPVGGAPRADDLLAALETLNGQHNDVPSSEAGEQRNSWLPRLSRREFVAATLAAAFALTLPFERASSADGATDAALSPAAGSGLDVVPVTLHINGADHQLTIDPRVTLLDALRERIGLTGSKKGCNHGQCGACTVLVDGRRINSCLSLALVNQGKQITTVEGLANGETLHPIQAAFIQHDGYQCGYCTSGQVVSAVALLSEPIGPDDADVREAMSGNLCRCGAYPNIIDAIQDVRKGGSHVPV